MSFKEPNNELEDAPWKAVINRLSPWNILVFLGLLVMMGILLGGAATFGLNAAYGTPLNEVMKSLSETGDLGKRQFVRLGLIVNHFFLFIIPTLALSLLLFRKYWSQFLGLFKISGQRFLTNVAAGTLLILSSMPFIQYVFFLNKNYLPIPEWARSIEDSTNAMIKNLLIIEAPWELWLNVIVIAIIPAFGEEFLFRGVIQKQLGRIFKSAHTAIWIAAALFSLTHLQLEGFFPRLILGALLGYLFYWSKSLWTPIIVHFIYNAIQIFALNLMPEELNTLETATEVPVPLFGVLLSLTIVIGVCIFIKNYNQNIE